MNMKETLISKKINKNINADRLLGILCFSVRKKRYVLSLGIPPFISSNYIRIKKDLLSYADINNPASFLDKLLKPVTFFLCLGLVRHFPMENIHIPTDSEIVGLRNK